MADNINFNSLTNQHSFVSRKEIPWHGLGKIVDAMTSEEAIKLGGLDFTVEKRPLLVTSTEEIDFKDAGKYTNIVRTVERRDIYEGEHGELVKNKKVAIYRPMFQVPGQFSTVRSDNNQPLGIVGNKYEVIQNSEAFDFIDSIIGQGKADYETVGALGFGETVFITCKLKDEMIINKDLIDQYLLITMSHDGTSSITVMFTPIRVVCNNTLTSALKGVKNKVTIKHTKNARIKLELSKELLGIVDNQSLTYKEAFGIMNKIQMNDNVAKDIISFSLGIDLQDKELSSRSKNIFDSAWQYYNEGIGQKDLVGTGWGVYNGITGYLQNVKEYSNDESKFKSTFNTAGVNTRNLAMNQILAFK